MSVDKFTSAKRVNSTHPDRRREAKDDELFDATGGQARRNPVPPMLNPKHKTVAKKRGREGEQKDAAQEEFDDDGTFPRAGWLHMHIILICCYYFPIVKLIALL